MKERKRDRKLLLKTAKRIERIPASYSQHTFYEASDEAPCGAVACLAGEIVICAAPSVEVGIRRLKGQIYRAMKGKTDCIKTGDIAARLAGFTDGEAYVLFSDNVSGWPEKFRDQYTEAEENDDQQGMANAAAGLLRYLAEGGEVPEVDDELFA